MWHDVWRAAFAFTLQPVASVVWTLLASRFARVRFTAVWTYAAMGGIVSGAIERDLPWTIGSAASLLVALAIGWWRSGKRRQAAALLGAKARALRDAIVRKAREAARPSPVRRPALGGAQ